MLKKYFKSIALLILSAASVYEADACSCRTPKLDSTYISGTAYRALVRINKIIDSTFKHPANGFPSYQVAVNELQLFKGQSTHTLLVDGGNRRFKSWTSCDLEIEDGQEWVVFGYIKDGVPVMAMCTHTAMYRAAGPVNAA